MSTSLVHPAPSSATDAAAPRFRSVLLARVRRSLRVAAKLGVGILLCGNPWTAILVVGWTFRAMRRAILFGWWQQSPARDEVPFDSAIAPLDDGLPARRLPRWLLSERASGRLRRPDQHGEPPGRLRTLGRLPGAAVGSLLSNLRWGLLAVGCTYVLTLPACGLWLGSWYDGWNTSFTKGYENAFVGAQTGVFAHLLFIAAMLYVPMAWAHLAASGRAGAFFQFGLLGKLIWRNGWRMTLFAAIFAVASLPVLALRAAPAAFVTTDPEAWADASTADILRFATRYQLAAGAYLFAAFVLLHLLTARLYRNALLRTVRDDPRLAQFLPDPIRATLFTLRLVPDERPRRGPILRAARWSAQTASNLAAVLVAAALWFAVIAQVYVGQFLNYIPWAGWLNQPLIHLPCLQTIPRGLS